MSFVAPFVPVAHMSSTGRGLKDTQGAGGGKCAIPQEREGQENKEDVALVFESEKRRSVPQPSSFLLRDMQARGRFQSVISGL